MFFGEGTPISPDRCYTGLSLEMHGDKDDAFIVTITSAQTCCTSEIFVGRSSPH